MKRIPKKEESPEKFNKALMILWKLFMLIILVVCVVSVITSYIQDKTDGKVEILKRYYTQAYDRAFTSEQVLFLKDVANNVDAISENKGNNFTQEELESPLLYGEEFESLADTYRDLMHKYNADSNRLDIQANKALESGDPEQYMREHASEIQDSKVIPAVMGDVREEYYSLLESRNIDNHRPHTRFFRCELGRFFLREKTYIK